MVLTDHIQLTFIDSGGLPLNHSVLHKHTISHMESTHGPGHGQGHGSVSWDPSGFGPGEPWGQQYGTAFDQDVSASGDYPSPEFTNNSALNSHMAGAVNHGDGLQNAYGFYRQGDVWPGHPQATTASFSQSSPPPHEYQRDRQQQFSGGNQTVAGRFTVDLHQGNGFPNQFARDMSQVTLCLPFSQSTTNLTQ